MKRVYFITLLVLIILAGCNNQNVEGLYEQNEDSAGTTFINNENRGAGGDQTRGRTMSDQNPNFVDLSGERVNNREDTETAKRVIDMTNEFIPDSVWVNGRDMWITVHRRGKLTQREKVDGEARLHEALERVLPEYNIEVKVHQERT